MEQIQPSGPQRLDGKVLLSNYDPQWPAQFDQAAARIRGALGEAVLTVEHMGSTSVPGLPAKPVIDIVLAVADSAEEPAYAPSLLAAGFTLAIREPDWFEHRLFRGVDPAVNLHVFSKGCPEIDWMRRFRDRLRADPADLALYAHAKNRLAQQDWAYMQDYADAKQAVIGEIMARAQAPTSGR
jgi:GrpB-like predicted nucleotidyltransferase (UPF0157 family)